MKKESKNTFPFVSILFLIFLVMKLAEIGAIANWSWWWVTSPIWITTLLYIAVALVSLLILFIKFLFEKR